MPVRIDDLGCPRLPPELRLVNSLPPRLARRVVSLDEEALLAGAARAEKLSDFGDPGFREPLAVLLAALEGEADLSPAGRFFARALVRGLLATRLRLEALLSAQPHITERPLPAPIFIVGLPRTGTTHLHNLLSQDRRLRSLPYWESLEPFPRTPDEGTAGRRRRCERALRFQHRVMPDFVRMHEMGADTRHEEIQLLAIDFATMLFEASYLVPSYRDWYLTTDQTPFYLRLRRTLQALQHLSGGNGRWLLKSPQHLEQLGPLLRAFPDARIVMTHRDPVRVTASMATMACYGLRMQRRRIDPAAVGAYWSARIERMLRAGVEDRGEVPRDQLMDLRFGDFMDDEAGSVERIYAFAGLELDAQARRAIDAYRDANPRGRHGSVDYRLEDLSLDGRERSEALRFYAERFALEPE